jgi:hypothetical protein
MLVYATALNVFLAGALVLLLGSAAEPPSAWPSGRVYRSVALTDVDTTSWTHVCTKGHVVYVRLQKDGDWHITLSDGTEKVVLEVIPTVNLDLRVDSSRQRLIAKDGRPVDKDETVEACGITRYDRWHRFVEIHPVERLTVLGDRER